jgi:glucoamylase
MKENNMKNHFLICLISCCVFLSACSNEISTHTNNSTQTTHATIAPRAPDNTATWAYAGKTGIGTSYEQYTNSAYVDAKTTGTISKVWFSLAQGILTETMYGLIHEAQLQEMQFFIQGKNFLDEEKKDTKSTIDYLSKDIEGRPLSLAYKIINKDKNDQYQIEKHFFTDPNSQALMMRVRFSALADGITPYLYINPSIANTSGNDTAIFSDGTWTVSDGNTSMSLITNAKPIQNTYSTTDDTKGNVAFTLQLPEMKNGETAQWDFVLGFGKNVQDSITSAQKTLSRGYDKVLAHYNGEGEAIGWQDYLESLPELKKLSATATDNGKLLYTSAMVLKAQEDKTYAGAFIASLSNPWGDSHSAEHSATGYKAVWPRDFYQVAMALLALGDSQSALVAFQYLQKIQAGPNTLGYSGTPGWFLQKTHVDGTPEWVAVQLDQTAMPIMLGWQLWKKGVMKEEEIIAWYNKMLKPAADFLVNGGKVKISYNDSEVKPPLTQQERWEEQAGYSPSSIAATIAGLIAAADIATKAGDKESSKKYLMTADAYSTQLDAYTYTTKGSLTGTQGDSNYYLRITANEDPNDHAGLESRNGQTITDESQIMDGGFLELVRYGVRAANDAKIMSSLPEYDNQTLPEILRVHYEFTFPGVDGKFPGWRRYGIDGYGEDSLTGLGYTAVNAQNTPDQRGRVWPIFTGERGHYELALAQTSEKNIDTDKLRNTYVKAMELFANEGMMLPEQVWDGVGNASVYNFQMGEGTNSATPLAWAHAEYIKLLRSISDKKVWDKNSSVEQHFSK